MAFADDVRKAFEDAEASTATTLAKDFLATLREAAEGLRELGIGADIVTSGDPRKRALYVYPRYRPQRGSMMLSFFLEADAIQIFGANAERLASASALRKSLLNFVQLPTFVESIHILREEQHQPVEARLRISDVAAYAKGDVMVCVTAFDQERIGVAAVGDAIELNVERIEFPGNEALRGSYKRLDSAGLSLSLKRVTIVDSETATLDGTRL